MLSRKIKVKPREFLQNYGLRLNLISYFFFTWLGSRDFVRNHRFLIDQLTTFYQSFNRKSNFLIFFLNILTFICLIESGLIVLAQTYPINNTPNRYP